MQRLLLLLADDISTVSRGLYIWSAILILVVAVLFAGVWFVRRKLRVEEDVHGEGFTLGDLRQMHKDGKLTTEEFDRAKAQMVAAMHAAQARQEAARAEAAKKQQRSI